MLCSQICEASSYYRNKYKCGGAVGYDVYNYSAIDNLYSKGGFVAKTAKVPGRFKKVDGKKIFVLKNVEVSEGAQVCGRAQLKNNAKVLGQARVLDSARILDNGVVSGHAIVAHDAIVKNFAHVDGYAGVAGKAVIQDSARIVGGVVKAHAIVGGQSVVQDDAEVGLYTGVFGKSLIKDRVQLWGHIHVQDTELSGRLYGDGYLSFENCIIDGDVFAGPKNSTCSKKDFRKNNISSYVLSSKNSVRPIFQYRIPEFGVARFVYQKMSLDDSDDGEFCFCGVTTKDDEIAVVRNSTLTTECGHTFHKSCLLNNIHAQQENSLKCPLCRSELFKHVHSD